MSSLTAFGLIAALFGVVFWAITPWCQRTTLRISPWGTFLYPMWMKRWVDSEAFAVVNRVSAVSFIVIGIVLAVAGLGG